MFLLMNGKFSRSSHIPNEIKVLISKSRIFWQSFISSMSVLDAILIFFGLNFLLNLKIVIEY